MPTYKEILRRINDMTAYADTPTHTNRDAEFRRVFSFIEGLHFGGAISDMQCMQLRRDVTDLWFMYDREDAKELAKANQGQLEV